MLRLVAILRVRMTVHLNIFLIGEPGSPRDVVLNKAEAGSITISWQAPEYDGGAKIKRYVIMSKEITAKKFKKVGKTAPDVLTYTITENIIEGKSYLVQVIKPTEL